MPTYDYVCDACDTRSSCSQSITESAKKKCPKCKKPKLRRLIGAGVAIVFKGSGFYQTDYRSDSYKKRAEADKPPSESKSSDGKSSDANRDQSSTSKEGSGKSSGDGGAKKESKKSE